MRAAATLRRAGHLVFPTLAATWNRSAAYFQRRRAAFLKPCS